jgi:hypothetical protein
MTHCAKCNAILEPGAAVCSNCKTPLPNSVKECPFCFSAIDSRATVCPNCRRDLVTNQSTSELSSGQKSIVNDRVGGRPNTIPSESGEVRGSGSLFSDLDAGQRLGLLGCVLMAVGVFAPLVRIPIFGEINYFYNGRGDGIYVLGLAGISLLLVMKRWYGWLWVTGGASMGMIVYSFYRFTIGMADLETELASQYAGDGGLFDELASSLSEALIESVQLQWGWLPLFAGALLLLVAGSRKTIFARLFYR